MRRLTRKKALTLVKEFDAFPKVPESYVESSASGGTGRTAGDDSLRPSAVWTRWNPGDGADFIPLPSVSHSFHFHGRPRLPGVLCVQRHVDEVRVWGGQRLQQVTTDDCAEQTRIYIPLMHRFPLCSKMRINVDITVAMRCQCKYRNNVSLPLMKYPPNLNLSFEVYVLDVRFRRWCRCFGSGGDHGCLWWFKVWTSE